MTTSPTATVAPATASAPGPGAAGVPAVPALPGTAGTPDAPGFPVPPRSRTPRLLRRLQAVVALALLVAGALGGWVINDLSGDLASAPALAAQYARLGDVRRDVSSAADLASRSVLGAEPAGGRLARAANDKLAAAAGLLVDAARARPQDAPALSRLSQDVLRYAQALSVVPGTPRAGALPALAAADRQLDDLLDNLDAARAELGEEASHRPASQNAALVVWPALALLAVVAWAGWVVARVSHRVLNLGVAGAAAALVVLLVVTLSAQGTASSTSDASRQRDFTRVVTIARAVDGLDQAQRVLTAGVVQRTWGATQEKAYDAAFSSASKAASSEDLPSLQPFANAKDDVAEQLTAGNWARATTLLTGDDTSPDKVASGFRANAATHTDDAVASAAAEPQQAQTALLAQFVLAVLVAVAGATLGVLGLARRLQEYR